MRKDFVQCQMVAHTIDKLKQDEREVGWGRPLEEVTTGSGPKGDEGGNRQGVLSQKNAGNRVSKPGGGCMGT